MGLGNLGGEKSWSPTEVNIMPKVVVGGIKKKKRFGNGLKRKKKQ